MALILIVDDDPDFLGIMKEFLKSEGYQVELAISETEAAEKARNLHPALFILDVIMPVTGIASVYESLQCQKVNRNIPIIFLSGLPLKKIRELTPSDANIRVVQKSDDWRPLSQAIHELLKDKPPQTVL